MIKNISNARVPIVLMAVLGFACLASYAVVRGAVNNAVEQQALAVAEIVTSQAMTARSVYAQEIAEKLRNDGIEPSEHSASMPGHVPIPAQFLKLVGRASAQSSDKLYEYRPVSKWNLEPSQGLSDDFLRWAWPQLEAQDQPAPTAAIAWAPISRFETQEGRRVLRYLAADPVSLTSCASCHNATEQSLTVRESRIKAGVAPGKQWRQHQLLGALSVTIPLDKAQQFAVNQINQSLVFFLVILIASFIALLWSNWRLAKQTRCLLDAENQLAQSELRAQTVQAKLEAKQGVEQAFAELSAYMRAIDQHAIVSVTDPAGRIVQVNDKLLEISGYSREELIGQDHRLLNSGTHGQGFFTNLWRTITSGAIWRGVICNQTKAGVLYWVDSAIVPLKGADGAVVRYVSIRLDITERIQAEKKMSHMATHDGLTGLANRRLLQDRIQQALKNDRRTSAKAALLFIDLDQFKTVNDTLGHAVGDRLLVDVARRLSYCVRSEDTVARLGGDEFIVFMPRLADVSNAGILAEKLQRALSMPFQIGDHTLQLGSSIGIAVFPDDGDDVDTLLRNSDTAMYQVKASGRNHFRFYLPNMKQRGANTQSNEPTCLADS